VIPRNYYAAPLSAFQTLQGVEWHATHIVGLGTTHFGSVDFSGDPAQQATFESISGVIPVGTLFHGTIPPAITTALQSFGVTSTDTVMALAQKILARFGGIQIHY
jgi:hypothetical protein